MTQADEPPTDRPSGTEHPDPVDEQPDPRVSSIPLDTEDGETVVIQQENVGAGNQVGGGEFKRSEETSVDKDPGEAAAEQQRLERQRPISDDSRPDDSRPDEDA